jgi:hypothetical protein
MNILIISVEHSSQLVEALSDPRSLGRATTLRDLVQTQLKKQEVAAIFEEARFGNLSIAEQLASQSGPPVRWQNISMTAEERRAAGILEALENRPHRHVAHNGPIPIFLVEERIPVDTNQEEFFVKRILEADGDHGKVIVLLGNMHVTHVAETLRAMGHTVAVNDKIIPAGIAYIPAEHPTSRF